MSSKTDKKKAIMPKLRFPEFRDSGPWEVKKVGDIFKVTRGEVLSMKLVSDRPSTETPYPVYSSQTKNNGLSGYYSDYLYEDAITWTTDGANAGDVKYRKGKFYCTNVCGVLLNEEGYANNFVAELLNTVTKKHVSYVGNPKLMNGVMAQIQIPLPQIEEQQKIADCLSSIDELIELEAKKLDALKAHKKGLMQQLFPQEGETTPRLRFPEFRDAGPWEVKRLGDLGTISKGKGISKSDTKPNGSLPCIRYGELYTRYGEVIREIASFTDVDPADLVLSKENDVIIPASGETKEDIATASCVVVDGVALGGDLNIFRSSMSGVFLAYYVRGNLKSEISKVAQGDSVVHLYPTQLEKLKLLVPQDPDEEQKIADCLSSLDELIELETKKLDALKAHKKGMMQQLFPSFDGGQG